MLVFAEQTKIFYRDLKVNLDRKEEDIKNQSSKLSSLENDLQTIKNQNQELPEVRVIPVND